MLSYDIRSGRQEMVVVISQLLIVKHYNICKIMALSTTFDALHLRNAAAFFTAQECDDIIQV